MPSGYPDWHKGVKADIIAQTIDLIKTSIEAVAVDKFDVDIVAQTVSKLDIDIISQSIAELLMFWKIGKCFAGWGSWNADPRSEVVILDITGRGILFYYFVRVQPQTESDWVGMRIVADDNVVTWSEYFALWNDHGFDKNTAPWQLLKYAADGECIGAFAPRIPLTFDESLTLKVMNYSNYSQAGNYWYIYTIL